jgi:hypothetical protein
MSILQNYLNLLPREKVDAVKKLRKTILSNLPNGFEEIIGTNGIDFVVPHSIYKPGYHCNPKQPLPFISIKSQKNGITIHHLGFYAIQDLSIWFLNEYTKHNKSKLEMGKGCIKFKKLEEIPYSLIEELSKKITVKEWINIYENVIR